MDLVDYDLPVAPYVQVAAQIRALIESGQIPAGSKIPSETRIVQESGVARSTARRAVKLLRDEGWVVTAPGFASYARHLPGDAPAELPRRSLGALVRAPVRLPPHQRSPARTRQGKCP